MAEMAAIPLKQLIALPWPFLAEPVDKIFDFSIRQLSPTHAYRFSVDMLPICARQTIVYTSKTAAGEPETPFLSKNFHTCVEGAAACGPNKIVHQLDATSRYIIDVQPDRLSFKRTDGLVLRLAHNEWRRCSHGQRTYCRWIAHGGSARHAHEPIKMARRRFRHANV